VNTATQTYLQLYDNLTVNNAFQSAAHVTEYKVHPRTGHEDPEKEQRYNSTLSLRSALDDGEWSMPHPGRFNPREKSSTHCIGGWVSIRAGLDGCGKSRPHRDSIRGPSSPLRVALPTTSQSIPLEHFLF